VRDQWSGCVAEYADFAVGGLQPCGEFADLSAWVLVAVVGRVRDADHRDRLRLLVALTRASPARSHVSVLRRWVAASRNRVLSAGGIEALHPAADDDLALLGGIQRVDDHGPGGRHSPDLGFAS
jgi:hypothetical protein